MSSKVNHEKVMAESKQIAAVWGQNAEFKMKDVTLESYQSDSATLETTLNEIDALELTFSSQAEGEP